MVFWGAVRRFLLIVFVILAACGPREPFLRTESVRVLEMLGPAAELHLGSPCPAADAMTAAYAEEVTSGAPLQAALPRFALKAAELCPQSRPYITTTREEVELTTIAPLVGGQAFAGDGHMQVEPWLWLRVIDGKVVGVELQLDQI